MVPRQVSFELVWDYSDGVRDAHMRQLTVIAQRVDRGAAHSEALSDLPDGKQAFDVHLSLPRFKFLHRFFAEILENDTQGLGWLGVAG